MDAIADLLSHGVEQLLGRAGGPLHLRLLLQPAMATILAVRAGLRDARHGRKAFLWAAQSRAQPAAHLLQSGWKDIGRLLLLAVVLDLVYQLVEFGTIHPVQTAIVAVAVALVPYLLLRGLVTLIAQRRRPPDRPASPP